MEPMRFKNAPLVELVADFRWLLHSTAMEAFHGAAGVPSRAEEFFSRFSSEISDQGFTRSERLIPQGFIAPLHLPMIRFRHPEKDKEAPVIVQVGVGIFSVHAVPPYQNWDQFRPVIQTCLETLFRTRDEKERNREFSAITLRYINRFSKVLTGGVPASQFIQEQLGFGLRYPDVVNSEAMSESAIEPTVVLKMPLRSDLKLTLSINPDAIPREAGLVMDLSVATGKPTKGELDRTLEVLESAHTSLRSLFLGLTERIRDRMGPA